MTVAVHQDICAGFMERVARAKSRALLLDYDGTLAPFTPDRSRAFPYQEIPELVSEIMRHQTRVVLISGRPATELVFLSGIHPHPEIWGSHGAERLNPDGSYEVESPAAEHQEALRIIARSLRSLGLSARMEVKPGGIAVHWRGLAAEEASEIEGKVRNACASLMRGRGLHLLPFDGGIELRVPGKNKGDVVSVILAEAGENVAAAFLGDDQTDENGFRAIKGRGLAVLVRPEPRPTMADVWLRPPDDLARFLRDWLIACGARI